MQSERDLFEKLAALCRLETDVDETTPSSAMPKALEETNVKNGSSPCYQLRYPPTECEGYPPVLSPEFIKSLQQVDFYIPKSPSDSSSVEPDEELACSLIRHIDEIDSQYSIHHVTTPDISFSVDSSRPVIILCHGYMSWRNQMMLVFLAANLSRTLGCHTLRFDFSGNGHSSGRFSYSNYDGEARDLGKVTAFVRESMRCRVACLIGHSKGAQSVLRYAWEHDDCKDDTYIPGFVNLSGRFSVPNTFDVRSRLTRVQFETLERGGGVKLGQRGHRTMELSKEDVAERISLDSSLTRDITGAVLTIHGDADRQVDVSNALQFHEVIPHHELHIVEKADHNFNGLKYIDHMANEISRFVLKHSLSTG